jgi:hypothetical protein
MEQPRLKRKTGKDFNKLLIGAIEAYIKALPAWVGGDLDHNRSEIRTHLREGIKHG